MPVPNWIVIFDSFLPQDDATVKCWGNGGDGQLGQGDTNDLGINADGPCPPKSTTASRLPATRVSSSLLYYSRA
jgi:hypothetical protein